ncbi:hypothetical protein [Salipiger mangrovisoli]|uniref:Uncharacterized protein n=1 Tax=Salipiger mangrovisoli TaxID=2865933 RepID=A0ABR9X4B4_9RHOB|nr:hypothetical protein [Salipiger mangrovisoli]MBE9638276.1 hypothetical protein [Salipiger mangrovisoli]
MGNSAVSISKHELRHLLSTAAAVCELAPSRYSEATVEIAIRSASGHVICKVGDVLASTADFEVSRRIAALCAIGPAAAVKDAVQYLRNDEFGALAEKAGLSPADVVLVRSMPGANADVRLAKNVLAVQHMEDQLGVSRFQRLAKALRDGFNQGILEWRLCDLVPQEVAQRACTAAADALAEVMGAESQEDTSRKEVAKIVARTNAEQAVREAKGKP